MSDETVEIAFCIDDAYALPMSVTLRSILAHTKRKLRVHVLDGGISAASREKILRVGGDAVRIVTPPPKVRELHESPLSKHWSGVILLRLELHDLLPKLDRVLSLDADLLIRSDIGELWDEGMPADCPVRMALSTLAPFGYPSLRDCGFHARSLHFNSGIMDMNLRVLRTRMVEAVAVLASHPNLLFPEMDAFNIAYQGEIGRLASRWHVQLHSYYRMFGADTSPARLAGIMGEAEMSEADGHPAIVHFLERWKPWHTDSEAHHGAYAVEWRRHAMDTVWGPELEAFAHKTTAARVVKALREELSALPAATRNDVLSACREP